MVMNTDKIKIMIFNKNRETCAFRINGIQLENVRSYKYLGFLLTPSGEISSGLNDLRDLGTAFNQGILTTYSNRCHDKTHFALQLRFLGMHETTKKITQ